MTTSCRFWGTVCSIRHAPRTPAARHPEVESVLGPGDPIRTGYTLDLWQDTPMSVGKVDRVRTVIEPGRFCTIAYAGAQAVARAWRILGNLNEMTIVQSVPGQFGVCGAENSTRFVSAAMVSTPSRCRWWTVSSSPAVGFSLIRPSPVARIR